MHARTREGHQAPACLTFEDIEVIVVEHVIRLDDCKRAAGHQPGFFKEPQHLLFEPRKGRMEGDDRCHTGQRIDDLPKRPSAPLHRSRQNQGGHDVTDQWLSGCPIHQTDGIGTPSDPVTQHSVMHDCAATRPREGHELRGERRMNDPGGHDTIATGTRPRIAGLFRCDKPIGKIPPEPGIVTDRIAGQSCRIERRAVAAGEMTVDIDDLTFQQTVAQSDPARLAARKVPKTANKQSGELIHQSGLPSPRQ